MRADTNRAQRPDVQYVVVAGTRPYPRPAPQRPETTLAAPASMSEVAGRPAASRVSAQWYAACIPCTAIQRSGSTSHRRTVRFTHGITARSVLAPSTR